MKITDKKLSEIGLKVKNNGRLLLIACGALAREILAVIKTNAWDHIDIQCLPAIYHNHPEKIVPAIRKTVIGNIDKYSNIFVVYADCGTGGQLEKLNAGVLGIRRAWVRAWTVRMDCLGLMSYAAKPRWLDSLKNMLVIWFLEGLGS